MATFCVTGAAVQLPAQTLGTMNMGGNPHFSVDSIAQTGGPERRWHSFPGGRFSLNPSAAGTFVIDPTPADLALDLGGYVGTKVLRLPKVARMVLVDASGKELIPTSQRTDWFPHKLALHSQHTGGATMAADDFFVDADSSLLRVIDVRNAGTHQPSILFPDSLPGADPDNDGIADILEYVLQGANSSVSTTGTLPTLDASGANFVFTYFRRAAATGTTQTFQYGTTLTGWAPVAIPGGAGVAVTPDTPVTGIGEVKITVAKGAEPKLFGRLQVVK